MVSIIIPNYNRLDYLKDCLQSISNQSYKDWEALVVDDGSTDGSKQLVEQFRKQDQRFKWFVRTGNLKGASVCRNMGVERANGDYIIFLDSDDLLAPNCLEQRVEIMENNAALDFSVFKMQFFKIKPGDDNRIWNIETNETILQRFLNLDAVWQTSGPIWRTKILRDIGGFNEQLQCWQDIDIHLKALTANLNYKLYYELPVDCYYRKDSVNSISQSQTNSINKLKSKELLYFWAVQKLKETSFSTDKMALHIVISAINGSQKQFFKKFYAKVKTEFSLAIQKQLKYMYIIRFYKFYKIKYLQSQFLTMKNNMVSQTLIGKYTNDD
jgi:glycosyltransferase involved in cell wall biosynthesis